MFRRFSSFVILSLIATTLIAPRASASELDDARKAARNAAQEFAEAEHRLEEIEESLAELRERSERAQAAMDELAAQVQAIAVERYVNAGPSATINDDDINRQVKATTYARYVTQGSQDTVDDYNAAREDFTLASVETESLVVEQEAAVAGLKDRYERVQSELDRLEEIERKRREEEARRRAAEEAARREAAARAAAEAGRNQTSNNTSTPVTGGGATSTPPPATSSGGGMVCPVAGATSFADTWGAPRSGGRRHKGVDMLARTGVPVVAPVSGTVTHRGNSVGGLSFHLSGDNGTYYYGTHLSAYENQGAGHVAAGTVIGYVGDTGNARGTPHLHFEIHPNNGAAVNPYPATRAACG